MSSLSHCFGGIFEKKDRPEVIDPQLGVEADYYFMAKRIDDSKILVYIKLWTIIIDHQNYRYIRKTVHIVSFP